MTLPTVLDAPAVSAHDIQVTYTLSAVEAKAAAYASTLPTDTWPSKETVRAAVLDVVGRLGLDAVMRLGAELRREDLAEYAMVFHGAPRRRHHTRWTDKNRLDWARTMCAPVTVTASLADLTIGSLRARREDEKRNLTNLRIWKAEGRTGDALLSGIASCEETIAYLDTLIAALTAMESAPSLAVA